MAIRYEEAGSKEYELLNDLIAERLPELVNAKFKIFFNKKKHISQGKIVLASIAMTEDLVRYLSIDEIDMPDGADYVMFLDLKLWGSIEEVMRQRIVSHELCHCRVEPESKRPYKTQDHDITDFLVEVQRNTDDPHWRDSLVSLLTEMYSQEKDDK
jgi:hypothetical protein